MALVAGLSAVTCVLPQVLLGGLPFSTSDSWSHTSYVNALLRTQDVRLVGAAMPGERYPLTFTPHHDVLAAVAELGRASALDVFLGAGLVLPCLIVLAYAA